MRSWLKAWRTARDACLLRRPPLAVAMTSESGGMIIKVQTQV